MDQRPHSLLRVANMRGGVKEEGRAALEGRRVMWHCFKVKLSRKVKLPGLGQYCFRNKMKVVHRPLLLDTNRSQPGPNRFQVRDTR